MGAPENQVKLKGVILDASNRFLIKAYQQVSYPDEKAIGKGPSSISLPESMIARFQLVQVVRRELLANDVLILSLARPGTMQPPTTFSAII